LVHGHCHQKAFDGVGAVETILGLIPKLEVKTIAGTCCGMADAFGYEAQHYDVSVKMAELDLLPAIRAAVEHDLIVADGTSCRHQIADTTERRGLHAVQVLAKALGS
jgi:Fe-S oxidoreductase